MTRYRVRKSLLPGSVPLLAAGLLAVAVAGLLGAAPLRAQSGAITGTITNAQTGAPLSAAQVSVEGTGLGALTQPNGKFLILKVPVGTYTVDAVLIGYANQSMQVTVTDGPWLQGEMLRRGMARPADRSRS